MPAVGDRQPFLGELSTGHDEVDRLSRAGGGSNQHLALARLGVGVGADVDERVARQCQGLVALVIDAHRVRRQGQPGDAAHGDRCRGGE